MNHVEDEKLFGFSFSKKLSQQQLKKKNFQTIADYLTLPLPSNHNPASHFTEEEEKTKRELPLIITTKSTYLL